jgi:hypothetical protein
MNEIEKIKKYEEQITKKPKYFNFTTNGKWYIKNVDLSAKNELQWFDIYDGSEFIKGCGYFPTALHTRIKNIYDTLTRDDIICIKYEGKKISNRNREMHSYFVEILNFK